MESAGLVVSVKFPILLVKPVKWDMHLHPNNTITCSRKGGSFMEYQYIQHIITILRNFPVIEGCIGGLTGAFLTVTAAYFVRVRLNLKEWWRKLLYILAGALVGMLINYNRSIGMLYTTMISGGWPVFVCSFRTVAKTFVESIIKTIRSNSRDNSK